MHHLQIIPQLLSKLTNVAKCDVSYEKCLVTNLEFFAFATSFSAIILTVTCICTCLRVWACRSMLYVGSNLSHSFIWNRFITQNSLGFVVYPVNALRKPPLANFSVSTWNLHGSILNHCFLYINIYISTNLKLTIPLFLLLV